MLQRTVTAFQFKKLIFAARTEDKTVLRQFFIIYNRLNYNLAECLGGQIEWKSRFVWRKL